MSKQRKFFVNRPGEVDLIYDIHLPGGTPKIHRSAILHGREDEPDLVEMFDEPDPDYDAIGYLWKRVPHRGHYQYIGRADKSFGESVGTNALGAVKGRRSAAVANVFCSKCGAVSQGGAYCPSGCGRI